MRTTLATDTVTVFSRELRPVLRDPFSVIFSMLQPLFFLALFAPLLPDVVGSESALQWFVPGIILMSCLFGTSATGANLLYESQTGSHERMLVSPLRRPALIIGRALKEIVPMFAQTVLIIAVTVTFGFRLHLAGTVMGLLILAVFCVGLGALSYTLALASKNQERPARRRRGAGRPIGGGGAGLQHAHTGAVGQLATVADGVRPLCGVAAGGTPGRRVGGYADTSMRIPASGSPAAYQASRPPAYQRTCR